MYTSVLKQQTMWICAYTAYTDIWYESLYNIFCICLCRHVSLQGFYTFQSASWQSWGASCFTTIGGDLLWGVPARRVESVDPNRISGSQPSTVPLEMTLSIPTWCTSSPVSFVSFVSFPPCSEMFPEVLWGVEVVEVELLVFETFETLIGPLAGTVTIFRRASVAGSKVT